MLIVITFCVFKGGGISGSSALYHLSKKGVKAVLLERSKVTSGTTWHTAALVWSLRPSDVDIQMLQKTRKLLANLEKETGIHTGWTNNGGIFIARTEVNLKKSCLFNFFYSILY